MQVGRRARSISLSSRNSKAKQIPPPSPAAKHTLLRRVTYDLTGLPPTPEDIDSFVADKSPDAFAKVVDRLLASPRYGERWGRHWLDVARYADSTGMDEDNLYPHAWRYRDYVIDAFNRDTPFDRFIKEQLAGDLLKTNDPQRKAAQHCGDWFSRDRTQAACAAGSIADDL